MGTMIQKSPAAALASGSKAAGGFRPKRHHVWLAVAALLVAGGVIGALFAARAVAQNESDRSRKAFEQSSGEVASTLQLSIQHQQDFLLNASAYLLGNPNGSSAEFTQWTDTVQVSEQYPELQGIGYATIVQAADLPAFAAHAITDPAGLLEPDGTYAGRAIAPTMSYLGAAWLDRPEREAREQPERVLDALAIKPTDVVADVGAGTGYFALRLAKHAMHVFATDLQPEMRAQLGIRADGVKNLEVRSATATDSGLPAGCCDLVLMVDVYHELADPAAVMATVRRALRPGGRLVLVEYRGEDPAVPIKPEHKMTLAQIRKELAGWRFVESLEFLPDQRVVIFN